MNLGAKYKIMAWILSLCLTVTLIPEFSFAAESAADKKTERETTQAAAEDSAQSEAPPANLEVTKEDVIAKTEDTTTYDIGNDQKMTVFHGGEVRYENDKGKLVDYDPSLVRIKDGEQSQQKESLDGYAYENKQGDNKHYLPETLSANTPVRMERENYRIEFSLTDQSLNQTEAEGEAVTVEKETVPTTYEEEKTLPIHAVYGSKDQDMMVTYTSGEYGLKETLTLNEKPESNVFSYQLNLQGLTARKNVTDGGITLYDKESGEIAGAISPPWMDDASGNAYSEAITYELKENAGREGEYVLTMTADEAYLADPDRKYPVTIDPSTTWKGSSEIRDAYIISGSYKNTNFYESGTKVMPVGKNSTGWHRTLMRFTKLTNEMRGQSVTSAKLTVYETGTGASKEKIGIHRLKEDWSPSTVTWNKRPDFQAAYDTITTKKTKGSAHTFNVLSYAKALADGSVSGYGLMLKSADVDNADYSCFYGSRTSSSSYRPKLVVTHYSKPTTASSASISPAYVKASTSAKLTYSGITSTGLNRVEYKVNKVTCGTSAAAYWGYTSSRTISSGSALPSLPNGCYQFYVRGVNTAGTAGGEKATNVVHVDNAAPTLTLSGPATSATAPSGIKSPKITWKATDTHLSSVQYSVDGGAYSSGSLSASGTQELYTFKTSGKHTLTMKATDKLGNVTTKTFTYYLDLEAPTIGKVRVEAENQKALDTAWTTDANPTIHFDGIKDNIALKPEQIQYAMVKAGETVKDTDYKAISFETISASQPYEGTFRLTEADRQAESGAWEIHLRAKDTAGNSAVKTMAYNRDNTDPTATIQVLSHSTGNAITDVKDVVTIQAELDGTGSPLKDASLKLYRIVTETKDGETQEQEKYVRTLRTDLRQAANVEWDTTEYPNGAYRLKAEVKDSSGLTGTGSYDVQIQNPLAAPEVYADPVREKNLTVEWKFDNGAEIAKMQYQMEGETEWKDVEDSGKPSGTFSIDLSKQGEQTLLVRGIDRAGVATGTASLTVIYDATAPEAAISAMKRGRIVGTAKDTWLKGWTLSWKKASAGEDAWKEFKKGTRAVTEGELGILDLTGAEFAEGTDYQVKLEVTDRAGNRSEATHTFQKDSQEAYIRILPASLTIKRPFWEQDSQSPTFTLSADTKKLELTAKESVDLSKGTTTWYVDNQKTEGENTCLNRDFSAWQDKKAHRILAIHQDGDGNLSYSRDVRENDLQKNVSFGETAATSMEQTVKVDQDTVSLRLQASQPGASYEVKAEGGTYQTATPGKTIRVAELLPEAAYANTFTIRVSLEAEAVMQPVVLELDTIEEESFTVSSLYNYLPQTGSMKHQLNDRAYLYWNNLLPEGDDSLSYNVYHSTEKDFTPSRKTLAAEHVKAGYYSEINVNYGKPFYYRITVVERDANGNVISESAPSELISGKLLDYNEHTKRLGLQDYWQYEEFNNPVGSGSVEKSGGNFVYQQTDAELPNEKLAVDLTRTYNSQSSQKSAFGLGWTHNYDLQLLNVYDEKAESFDNVVLKDSTGSIFRFTRSTDPKKAQTYISQAGEYLTLTEESKTEKVQVPERKVGTAEEDTMRTVEVASQYTMRTKDNLEYRFNGGGQLVYLTEPNGSFLLFEYEGERGLLKKATTNRGLAMEFVYENGDPKDKSTDMLLIKQIRLPDGSKREYQYKKQGEHSLLTEVITTGKDGKSIPYTYEYDGAENPNVDTIKDAKGNTYTLEYTDEKVTEAVYPDQEGLSFNYSDAEESQTKTEITRFDGTGFLTGGKELSKTCGYYEDSTGYCLKDINANGKETKYAYKDGICISSSWNAMAYAIGADGIIRGTETDHKEWTDLGARRNETKAVSEDGSTANYTYYADTSDLDIQDLIYHEETLDADGEVTEEHYYEYDEWGNEIEDYDAFEDVTTVSDYYEDEEDEEFAGELETETEYFGDPEAGEEIRTTSYTYAYDSEGNKTETETEICGSRKTETVTTYDAMGQETSVVSRSGAASKTLGAADVDSSVTTEYDSFGRAVKETSVEGAVTTVTENTYDDNGTLLSETVTTSDGSQTRTTVTTYTYDERNRQATRTVNDNGEIQVFTTSYGYESVLVHASDGTGTRLVENAYRIEERKQDGSSDGYLISQTYQDGAGNTIRAKSNGLYTDTLYDGYGTELGTYEAGKQADAEDGLLTLKVPDKNGNILATVQKPAFQDGAWRIAEDSIVTTATYDSSGKETSNTDAMGNTTKYGYDSKGELNLVTVPEGGKTAFDTKEVYVNGELRTSVKTTDAKENLSETVTNEEGQELEITDHYKKDGEDQSVQSLYTYDEKGRLSEKKEARGNSVTYEYDSNDRVAKAQYYETVDGAKTQTLETAYTYDVNGNVTRMCDYEVKDGARTLYRTTVYAYDPQNRLTSMAEWDGGELPTQEQIAQKKITYTYDTEGKVTGVDYALAKDGITGLTYTYDNDDYLTTITAKGGLLGKKLREYVYDDFGRVTKMKDYYGFAEGGSDHILREYTYDAFGRVTKMTYTDSKDGEVKESYGYTYDKNSNILQERLISHYAAADEKELDCTKNYTYDKNGRLTKAEVIDHTEGGAGSGTTEYTYDLAGNRDKELTPEGLLLDYHYNGLNQLFLIETEEQDDTGEWQVRATETYTYDRNGNQTGKTSSASGETISMTYDAANRLAGYEKKKDGTTLLNQKNRYNGEGHRIRKEETKGKESSVRNYYYQDGKVLYTTDGANQRDSFNLLGLEDNVIATARGTGSSETWYLYNKDTRGSTSSLIDDGGTAAAAYEYDAFGNTTARIGENFDNEICYTGQVYDKETGLYYYNARFYDPEDGRFLTQDTYRGEQMEPDTLHLYAYCANNPVNYVDPSGHAALPIVMYVTTIFLVTICYYTTTKDFQKSWQSAVNSIQRKYKSVSRSTKNSWKKLCKGVMGSFARVKKKPNYKSDTEDHHIVAEHHRSAQAARNYYVNKTDHKINDPRNLVELKTGLHKRLHRKVYFALVNDRLKNAYKNGKNKKEKTKKVDSAVGRLKAALKALNAKAPF